jgi:hypothetical protein
MPYRVMDYVVNTGVAGIAVTRTVRVKCALRRNRDLLYYRR